MFPKGIWPCHTSLAATVPVLTPQLALLPPAWLLSPLVQDPELVCSKAHGDFVKIQRFQLHLAAFDLGHIQHIVDQLKKMSG